MSASSPIETSEAALIAREREENERWRREVVVDVDWVHEYRRRRDRKPRNQLERDAFAYEARTGVDSLPIEQAASRWRLMHIKEQRRALAQVRARSTSRRPSRSAPRTRGAGRPRAAATRSGARAGDSGGADDSDSSSGDDDASPSHLTLVSAGEPS